MGYTKNLKIYYNNTTIKIRKDPKYVRSYRSVALTNIFCKIFKRMTNKRKVWYLEEKRE